MLPRLVQGISPFITQLARLDSQSLKPIISQERLVGYRLIQKFDFFARVCYAGSMINVSQIWATVLNTSWVETLASAWQLGKGIIVNRSHTGLYEVLNYESTLTIHDPQGKRATFSKTKRVRYLQNNILAFQDYAWGDGKILLNYRTNTGKPVDRYRSGYKTYILISLREVKNRGDEDEFHIRWDLRDGFLTPDGYWSTDVSQRTRQVQVRVIFPKARPPQRFLLEESNRKRTLELGTAFRQQLPDGRWQVSWEMDKPRLYEIYVLRWVW